MTQTQTSMFAKISLFVGAFILMSAAVSFALATPADAATYAYVDAAGDVRSVTADNWMIAIDIAPNRHLHSGVLLLKSASDFGIVGDNVSAF